MAEQVILEIVPQVVGEEAIENEIKGVGEAAQQAFKKANTENAKYIETMQRIEKAVITTGKATNATAKDIFQMYQHFQKLAQMVGTGGIEDIADEAEKVAKETLEANKEFEQFKKKLEETTTKSKSMKTELRELKTALTEMADRGEDGTKKFQDMMLHAAKLENQIDDTATRVRKLASDTFKLDASIEMLKGVTAAYAAAQGIQGLFGQQNEDFQKSLLKVQSALALVTAAQELKTLTEKYSSAQLLISQGIEKLGVGIKNAYLLATGRLTAAQVLQTSATRSATAAQTLLNNAMKVSPVLLIVSAVAMLVGLWSKYADKQKEISEIESELYALRLKGIQDNISNVDKFYKHLNDINETQIRIAEIQKKNELQIFDMREKALEQEGRAIDVKRKSLGIESEIRQRLTAAYGAYYEAIDNGEESAKKEAQSRITLYEGQLSMIEELAAKSEELENKKLILAAERAEKEKEIAKRSEMAKAETAVLIAADGSKKQLDATLAKIKVEYKQEIDNANLTAEEKTKIYIEYLRKTRKAEQDFFKLDRLDTKKQSLEDIFGIEGLGNEQKATIALSVGFSKEEVQKKLQELNQLVLEGTGDMKKIEVAVEPKADMEVFKEVYGAAVQAAGMIISDFYDTQSQMRQQDLSDSLNKLDEQRAAELSNKELTEAQRAAIDQKYRRLEAAEKLKAWRADQQAKGEQALINGLLAFTMAIAQNPTTGYIQGAIAMGLAAIQAGLIFGKQPPAFAKGTKGSKVTPHGFKLVGEEGPELIYDNGGKKVITSSDTAKILAAYNIPTLPDMEGAMGLKDAAVGYGMPVIDYGKLGEAVGNNIAKHPKVSVNIDKNGFNVFQLDKLKKVEFLNNKYNG